MEIQRGRITVKLVLLRHGESAWNRENRFTGWTDVDLSPEGRSEAQEAGRSLEQAGFDFDLCYTSYLKRAINTLHLVLEQLDREWLPVIKSYQLNERHYGALQGLDKGETADKYGEEQVHRWQRSYTTRPPLLTPDDPRYPARLAAYRDVAPDLLPLAESLQDTVARAVPYFQLEIEPAIRAGRRVLIAAHGNSLRALVMYLEKLTPEAIAKVNLPTGVPLVYELSDTLKIRDKYYLGDRKKVAAKMQAVADQGRATQSA
ncbi:2,3-diphosphoglycerate-dependent phosphoglycerate mutase [Neobittarella massiliensis]|uniref:2,3-bisphosphoglycerate-dependent phosphoglycerate mutase n=1 Tax=Neobittarella massiliensis (ex Bilen et al. 2018) TaxID=2041842 RepID=A0A8J6ILM5_9FIRM|nr:2,3-diphosphoglycerate-dependent phosphoglycerate mutase [Neobittarella massiliensis]MBC3515769.1 2,3-diphosphoglycerate-dependent phosphoglycerate mutase [Neobittarella massiliensis]